MVCSWSRFHRAVEVASAALWAVLASVTPPAAAQPSPAPMVRQPPPNADFLFGRPTGAIAVHGGWLFANTGSDVYDFVTDQLTLSRSAFNAPVIGGEFSVALSNRLDIVVGFERAASKSMSEYRDLVDNRLLPIAQTTSRREYNLSASMRIALLPKGRRISRLAWVPRTVVPYVGAGAGALKYEFQQYGSFVDFATTRVFDDSFRASGWAPSAHALAGADVRVFRRVYLTVEGRYTWSSGTLGSDFVDFDPISLAGFRVNSGLRIVF